MIISDIDREVYRLRIEQPELSYKDIGEMLGISGSACAQKFNKTSLLIQKESKSDVARLNITPSTYRKLQTYNCFNTIQGCINFINEANHNIIVGSRSYSKIGYKMLHELYTALVEAGYEVKALCFRHGLHFTSDIIYNDNEMIIKFGIIDTDGIFTCNSDYTNCKIYLERNTRFPKEVIITAILEQIKDMEDQKW